MIRLPRWAQSIRFRLSLAYALAVFATGAVLLAALMAWQWQRLRDPIMVQHRPLLVEDLETGEVFDTQLRFFTKDDLSTAFLQDFERRAYAQSLTELRKASLTGLGVLFIVSFGTGWFLAAWTLRPMGRMAAVARDISANELSGRIGLRGPDDELKDLADTFDEMLDRLQASFEGQRAFVQDASHELRNPLAIARTNLELVLDDPSSSAEELRAAAEIAQSSTGRLSGIVDDLVAQARDAVPGAKRSEIDCGELVERVAAELRASASARDITLVVERPGPSEQQPVVRGDAAALQRAVTNLTVNAIRLAPEGSSLVLRTSTDGTEAAVSVADEGPGIGAEHLDDVFERFWRGDEAGKGLGLGLSIVRQVAERHGGKVELDSTVGDGSTFTLIFPMPVDGTRHDAALRGHSDR